jgi:hypothetical protein
LRIRLGEGIIHVAKAAMKMHTLFLVSLLGLGTLGFQNALGGSAVGTDGLGHNVYSYGHPTEIAMQRALEEARRKGWLQVRIVAATDTPGYGAIAVALHPNGHGSVLGITVGKRSATEADSLALKACLKAGGTNPKVKWTWKG